MSRTAHRIAATFILAAFLAGAAHAVPLSPPRGLASEPAALAALWDWIASWFAGGNGLSSAWAEAGSHMDPNGGTSGQSGDAGSSMDPNGGSTGDEGSHMDPNG